MNNQSPTLAQLGDTWLADSPPSLLEHSRRLRHARRRNHALMAIELVVALAGCAIGWLVSQSQPAIGGAAIAFSLFGLTVSLATRMRLSQVATDSVASALQSGLAELEAQYRVAIGGVCVCIGALIFVAVIMFNSDFSATSESEQNSNAIGIAILFTGAALAWSVGRLWHLHRQRQQLKVASARCRISYIEEQVD